MKFKFLTVLAITGMVYAGCNSNKGNNSADSTMSDTSTVDTSMTDTTMSDTAKMDTMGKVNSPGTTPSTRP